MTCDKNYIGLYVHIPFCAVKCPYCDFYSTNYTRNNENLYTAAVIRNAERYGKLCSDRIIDTIYFGGGTPSIISTDNLKKIIDSVFNNFNVAESAEISIEANPNTLNEKRCKEYLSAGINRISVGIQSFNDEELINLGRKHTSLQAENAVIAAYNSGFKNISCDLMLGIGKQNINTLQKTLEKAVSLPVKHISAYMLKIEENTPFNCDEIINNLPDDETFSEMYLNTVDTLENYGFMQYEISNFAKDGFESRHNLKYWKCEEYIGIAPSAHSYFNGERYAVPSDLQKFISDDIQTENITDEISGDFSEKAMLALRLKSGLSLDECVEHKNSIIKKADMLIKNELAYIKNNKIILTPKGFLVSNQIIEYLVF